MAGVLRITGGSLGGRHLRVPPGTLRPTQDRVREALFSSLQALLPGASFLDLFAGSGAVGIEAWSRGAARVCWVEADRRVFAVLKSNVGTLCGDAAAVQCRLQDVYSFCRGWRNAPGFDIIFADPPYAEKGTGPGSGSRLLEDVRNAGLATAGGLLVLEQGAREEAPVAEGWALVRERSYGRACLRIYRRGEASQ
jgi:16S rRNA (guanine966-N2)-methyltransferase